MAARKFTAVDRAAIERELAAGHGVLDAAERLGISGNHLYLLLRRHRIALPPRRARPPKPRLPTERHPPAAAIVAEMDALRLQARLLVRCYGHCHHRIHELRRIEARHRELREQLRRVLGDGEATETRERSRAGYGLAKGTRATWVGQR